MSFSSKQFFGFTEIERNHIDDILIQETCQKCYRCNRNRDSKFYRCDPSGYLEWSCHKRIDRYMDPYFCPIAYREGVRQDGKDLIQT